MTKLSYKDWLVKFLSNMDQYEADNLIDLMSIYNDERDIDGLRPVTFGEYLKSEYEIYQESSRKI